MFILFFLFYGISQITTVLLAMNGVNSNLFISKEQIVNFFQVYGLDINQFDIIDYYELNGVKNSLYLYYY